MRAMMCGLALMASAAAAWGQSSSMMRMPTLRSPGQGDGKDGTYSLYGPPLVSTTFGAVQPKDMVRPATRVIEMNSLIAIPASLPRKFKVEDLISIIVKQQKKYQADGKLDTDKKWNLNGKLSDWFRLYNDDFKHLGTDTLPNGKPGFKFDYQNKVQDKSDNERQDTFTTRIETRVIDVKPNGNLVLEGKMREAHDEEEFTITLTGVCRSEDVTPANTILSTQVSQLELVEQNHGAVRDGTRRGWMQKGLDWLKPF